MYTRTAYWLEIFLQVSAKVFKPLGQNEGFFSSSVWSPIQTYQPALPITQQLPTGKSEE